MAITRDVIHRALRLIKVQDIDEAMPAINAQRGLDALNQMLTRWEADGIRLGFNTIADIGDAIPVPDEALEAVTCNLAITASTEFGGEVTQLLLAMAQAGKSALERDSFIVEPANNRSLPGGNGTWSISGG